MKKISIITILDNINFGTYLQALALCKTIELLDYQPELIAYCRPGHSVLSQYKKSIQSTNNPLKMLARTYYAIRNFFLRKKDISTVKKYLTKYKYYSFNDLKNNPPIADMYMTGSDQVWNSIYNNGIDRSFYLDFAPTNSIRTSYAASIGMSEIPQNEKEEMYKLLSKYNSISVRESSAIKLLTDIGLPEQKITQVIDPTLLLDKKDWSSYVKRRIHNFPYLLVYSVENKDLNNLISDTAKAIAQKYNLKIIGVYYGNKSSRIEACEINHYRATPDIFLSLMYYANFIVVSSFHGTAFAINFKKNFVTISPKQFNSRVKSLLHQCCIENHMIHHINELTNALTPINYSEIDATLKSLRRESINYLNQILKQ